MSITVKPDPDHPLGGHALILVDVPVAQGPLSLTVLDLMEDRHLGPKGWQSAPVSLGPYAARDEGGTTVLPVGPEVVDRMEAFTPLRMTVGGVSDEVTWPDSVRGSPSRAGLGGVSVLQRNEPPQRAPAAPEPKPREAERAAAPPPDPGPLVAAPKGGGDEGTGGRGGGRLAPVLLLLAALAAAGAGAWWFLGRGTAPVETAAPVDAAAPSGDAATVGDAAGAASAGCDGAALAAAAALPPAEAFAAVAGCVDAAGADARFAIIEAAAAAGVGEAVAMIGRWYDPAEAAAVGSAFSTRDPALAARYYRDAAAAGYGAAAPLLERACASLDPEADPTHELAREQFCPRP
jgi:hypothetical protein